MKSFKQYALIFCFLTSSFGLFGQGIVTDVDGNTYNTVRIGDQEWMAENLKTTHYHDGQAILTWKDSLQWMQYASSQAAYCWYKNDSITYKPLYGALYNWHAAQDSRLCPIGWRVPTQQDYIDLIRTVDPNIAAPVLLSETAGKALKETGHANWPPYENIEGSNTTGFSAIGAGCRGWSGWYNAAPYFGYFWTYGSHWSLALRWATDTVFMNDSAATYVAISIRCVKGYSLPVYGQLFNKTLTK